MTEKREKKIVPRLRFIIFIVLRRSVVFIFIYLNCPVHIQTFIIVYLYCPVQFILLFPSRKRIIFSSSPNCLNFATIGAHKGSMASAVLA